MTSPSKILADAWRLYRGNASLLIGYASWLLLTYAAFILAGYAPVGGVQSAAFIVIQIVDTLLWLWVSIVMTRVTLDLAAGKTPDAAFVPASAGALIWPFAVVVLLQTLVTLGGFLLLIIPGFLFLVWFGYAQQAMLIDGVRGIDALSKSRSLVRGRFFTAVWNLFYGPFVVSVAYLAFLTVVFVLLGALTGTSLETMVSANPPLWLEAIASVGEIFLVPLLYAYWTLSYLELKKSQVVKS